MNKKYGVIDFGTNSARLMISSFDGKNIQTLSKDIENIRLGDGMTDGIITQAAMQRAKNTTLNFKKIAADNNVDDIFLFATSAVREAKNTGQFVSYIKDNTGFDVDVISGDLEAKVGFLGATYKTNERVGLIDVGGGSTEVVFGKGDDLAYAKSFVIGIVRLLQNFGQAGPQNLGEYEKCKDEIIKTFTDLPPELNNIKWLGIGGTATALAAIHLKLKVYDPDKVDNYYISMELLDSMLEDMMNQTVEQRKNITGLEERRADVIVFGALIMSTFLKLVNADGITACESDNLEGYLLKKLGLY